MKIRKIGRNMMKDKRGILIKKAFFAAIIFSMIIIAVGVMIDDWGNKYNSGLSYDLDGFSDLDTFSKEAEIQKNLVTPEDSTPGGGDFESKIFGSGYGIFGRIFLPFTTVFGMLEDLENRFGLPSWISEAILAMMIISLVIAIITIIFRLGRSTV